LPQVVKYADLLPLPNGLKLPVGVDAHGHKHYHALTSKGAPHILVGGSTGSGKSVLINGWLTALVTHHSADQIQLYLIDLKQVEFAVYQHVPHVKEVATDGQDALLLLDKLLAEVKSRYAQVAAEFKTGIPDGDVADKVLKQQPRLMLVIDELAELTLTYPEAVNTLIRLAQISRAAKVNIIAATQRPDVKVCPGNLKTNFDNRLALALPTQTDSRVILDAGGAELLAPPGQALWRSGSKTTALVVPLLTEEERNAQLRQVLDSSQNSLQNVCPSNELVKQVIKRILENGKQISVTSVYAEVRGQATKRTVEAVLREWRASQKIPSRPEESRPKN
jgi:DNA segregation ATPase FtsK/SpoIIIE, S-DNA-T family